MDLDAEGLGWIVSAFFGLLIVFVVLMVVSRILCICRPNEILIISGRKIKLADGSTIGYKVLHGGLGWRIPILEELNRMDMRLIPVMVEVQNAYSKGGIPLIVHAIANVKISSDRRFVRNAIERLLTMTPGQIGAIAQQTLEGVLREVVAELTPEEVNEDRLRFASTLMKNATDDFEKLGLELDVLKVQSVYDEQKYLENLGRAQIANMLRDAENAENSASQAINEAIAHNRERAETAQKQGETMVVREQNQLRSVRAKLDGAAQAIENEAEVSAETAKAQAEQELQALRGQLEALRLQVDVFLPAEADRLAAEAKARADAAPVVENGRATAESLKLLSEQWKAAGRDGRDVYALQHLGKFIEAAVARVSRTEIGKLRVVDGGDNSSYTGAVAAFPAAVRQVLHETGAAMGVDINALLAGSQGVQK